MSNFYLSLIILLVGLCLGSFAGALVWRLRLRQLSQDKNQGEDYDKKEFQKLSKLTRQSWLGDRSKCLDCGYELHWYDLIPIISWLILKGKCRSCKSKIGWGELLVETLVGVFFVVSLLVWPLHLVGPIAISLFILWLIMGVGLAVLWIYDYKWQILPDVVNYSVIAIALVIAILKIISAESLVSGALSVFISVLILSGLYGFIYLISKAKWVGFGDVKLGLALGLALADWRLALLTLLLANLIGSLIYLPLMFIKKVKRNTQVPFGPLLIAGFIIAGLFGQVIVDWYISLLV